VRREKLAAGLRLRMARAEASKLWRHAGYPECGGAPDHVTGRQSTSASAARSASFTVL
jgi:hypothetical protein